VVGKDRRPERSRLCRIWFRAGASESAAIGFNPKPQVVAVELSHGGVDEMKMSDRSLEGDRFTIHPKIPAIAKLFS
jgi:hypothetical protein